MQTIEKNGRTYALVPIQTWRKLSGEKTPTAAATTPLPARDSRGNVDAITYARASIARSVIQERQAAGLSQAELARAAGMDRATLNRIERAKVTLDEATYRRLQKAMKARASRTGG